MRDRDIPFYDEDVWIPVRTARTTIGDIWVENEWNAINDEYVLRHAKFERGKPTERGFFQAIWDKLAK